MWLDPHLFFLLTVGLVLCGIGFVCRMASLERRGAPSRANAPSRGER